MSGKVMGMVFEAELPRVEKFVLLAIADHADDEGCDASEARIVYKTGYDLGYVQQAIKQLRKRGILVYSHAHPEIDIDICDIRLQMLHPQAPFKKWIKNEWKTILKKRSGTAISIKKAGVRQDPTRKAASNHVALVRSNGSQDHSTHRSHTLPSGHRWSIHIHEIVIPETQVQNMTAQEIGDSVLSLVQQVAVWREEYYADSERTVRRILARPESDPTYQILAARDGERCQVPGCREHKLQIDHIVARSTGGGNDIENLQLLCIKHNLAKGAKSWTEFLDELWTCSKKEVLEMHWKLEDWHGLGYNLESDR